MVDFKLITTSKLDLNAAETTINPKNSVYLFEQKGSQYTNHIDPLNIIFFLSTLNDDVFKAKSFNNLTFKIDGIIADRRTEIYEKSNPNKTIFKIRYNSEGTLFSIQLVNCSQFIHFGKNDLKPNVRTIHAFFYDMPIIRTNLSQNRYNIRNNRILAFFSRGFNGRYKRSNVNKSTACLFYLFSPRHPKAERAAIMKQLNPNNTLEGVFDNLGGYLFIYKGLGKYVYKGNPVIGFVWLHANFLNLINLSDTIELDTSFHALEPDVFCVPQLVYRNTGFPLGIIAGPSESADLYSMFFEALKSLDPSNELFHKFLKKQYLSDQHSSFKKLVKRYNISLWYCLVHLIRNCGARSPLSIIVRDILFCISEEEFATNLVKWRLQFQQLTKDFASSAISHAKLFEKITVYGSIKNIKQAYSPLFHRIDKVIPTSTNHAESFHHFVNQAIPNTNLRLLSRVALLGQKVNERLLRVNESIKRNFTNYLNALKKRANAHCNLHPEDIEKYSQTECSCLNTVYYSLLYNAPVSCIHTILNQHWSKIDVDLDWYKDKEILLDQAHLNLVVYELDEILSFNKDDNKKAKKMIIQHVDIMQRNKYQDIHAQMIYECHHQLNYVMKIDDFEVSSIAMKVYEEMLNDKKLRATKERSPDEFYAIMPVRIWKMAYTEKKLLNLY